MSTPDPSEEIQVTNNSGSPVVILLPTTSTQTQDANATVVYGQQEEVLTAVDGSTSIPSGQTKTFVLDQTYVDPNTGQTEYSTIYDLLPSTASWYQPVANLGVIQGFDTPPTYPPQTVTAASVAAFNNAALFVQTIAAYPTSALATSYQQAVSQSQSNASGQANGSADSSNNVAQSISGTVDAFFQGTKTFQNVTLAAVVAIQSYYATFPFVWAQYQNTATTYYLYSSNGTATSFVGTLSLTPPAALNVAAANGGYQCAFTPASNGSDTTNVNVNTSGAKNLTYTNGLFVDNPDSDIPQIAVKGTFQIQSLFTGKSTDTNIIPVLTGTVDGTTCIGFDQPQLSSDPNSTFWDTLFHPQNAQQIFQSIMEIGGFVMLLVFAGQMLYGAYKFFRGLGAAKQPTTEDLLNEKFDAFQQNMQKAFEEGFKQFNPKGTPPASTEAATSGVKTQTDVVSDNVSAGKLQTGLEAQAKNLETVAELEPDMNSGQLATLESAAGDLRSSMNALETAPTTDLGPTVTAQTTQLKSITTDIGNLQEDLSSSIGAQTQAEMNENTNLTKQVTEEVENMAEEQQSVETNDDPKSEGIEPEGEFFG